MKLVCSQAELNAALQLVSRAVASRPTHPVLANVLLTADAGTDRLSLTGFDLNLGIQTSLPAFCRKQWCGDSARPLAW
jgi:DNA polymerase-3 subunit beta